jgi:hypothetical protein
MTLEERLMRRLRSWQELGARHRMDAEECRQRENLHPDDREEALLHELEAGVFERCAGELAADLSARNDPHERARTHRRQDPPDAIVDTTPFDP